MMILPDKPYVYTEYCYVNDFRLRDRLVRLGTHPCQERTEIMAILNRRAARSSAVS